MGLIDNLNAWIRQKVVGWLEAGYFNPAYTNRSSSMIGRRDYRLGEQKRFLRKSREGYDDNVVGNFLGLALDRSISLLFGKEIAFDFGEDAPDDLVEYIDGIWEANNKPLLLHKLAMYGGEDGTVFVKLVKDEEKGWRIIAQDPIFKDIVPDQDDDEKVLQYITQYKTVDQDGKEISKRETFMVGNWANPELPLTNWLIRKEISSQKTGGKWVLVSEEAWPYPLPPIIHWQNLPMVGSVWGMPDLPDDVIEIQDKSNFNLSNINRIIRFFAHPFRWSRMFGGAKIQNTKGDEAELDTGPEKMPNSGNEKSEIFQLPPVGDVPGATSHAQNLRQIIFDVTRNTDITSMKDKVGALTNFGLRILFFDALNKLETKRNLYGWGLREINRRIQLFDGIAEPFECEIVWEDPLPIDEKALRENAQADLNMGIVSKQTISEHLGYDWDREQERLQEQEQAQADVGAMALRNFERFGFSAGGGMMERGGNGLERRSQMQRQ